ncbi:hypothetical protein, partial [Enterococcus faecium]
QCMSCPSPAAVKRGTLQTNLPSGSWFQCEYALPTAENDTTNNELSVQLILINKRNILTR